MTCRCCTPLLYEACKRPVPRSQPASELGALGGTRTPNLLIRKSGQAVQNRPSRSWAGPIFQSCPPASAAVRRLGNSVGNSRGGTALIRDRLLFRPGISQVGVDRASVMRCRRSLLVAGGCCRCCHCCCQLPWNLPMTARTVQGMAPDPGQARCLALGFWPECFRPELGHDLTVAGIAGR
jgi:hypothetical protein